MWVFVIGAVISVLIAYVIHSILAAPSDSSGGALEAFISNEPTDGTRWQEEKEKIKDKYVKTYNEPGKQILILYATEYGFSEEVARQVFDRIESHLVSCGDSCPWQPRIVDAKNYDNGVDLSQEQVLLVVISTTGDGVPPTDAQSFVNDLVSSSLDLHHLMYSVLALGDTNYVHFCKAGRSVDQRLAQCGATAFVPRHDVDSEDWNVITKWIDLLLQSLPTLSVQTRLDYLQINIKTSDTGYNRTRPFMATLKTRRHLTVEETETDKTTIHCEFDLTGSGLCWTTGDALGIYPQNNPEEVRRLLGTMGCTGKECVDVPDWAYHPQPEGAVSLELALTLHYDLKNVKLSLLEALRLSVTDPARQRELGRLLEGGTSRKNSCLQEFLQEREVADVLEDFHDVCGTDGVTYTDIVSNMRALQPRYYSISSSPLVDANTVCITVSVVRYSMLGRARTGVATTYLSDRLNLGQSCPVFMSRNPQFRLPRDGRVPIIMVGPGTGLAPFISFMQERVHSETSGRNLLYFGCRHQERDFLYRRQLEAWESGGHLELRLAFSRDQPQKVYVQHLMGRDGADVWRLLSADNAHLYVCGDARHMARDVHQAVLALVRRHGNVCESEAVAFVAELERLGRYQRDVWIT